MADKFVDPTSQAKLDKLLAALQGKQAELNAVIAEARAAAGELGTVSAEAAATQQAQARELSRAGAPRTTAADTTAALRERITLQRQLNTLVEQEVKLRGEAAVATTRGAPATAEQRVLTQMQGRGGVALGGGAGAGAGAARGLADEERLLVERANLATFAEANLGAATQRNVLWMGQLSNELQRHGAMTTEFIQAAARGQVTLREFGSQIGQTIGKFAGWTLAATAVYGTIAAVHELAKGAIDAQSGVQGLMRFIPDLNRGMATMQVGQIAQDLNVPIEQVTEAAGAFARIFKNQNDVMTASRVAITATKLDNISLADSYRYLTAFTQEYGLSASQLPGLFDQIEAAQAKGGARVSELFPALARSVAAVKNMGGDINQLLALEATAIVRTGQTGNVVGTAFSRGAANFWQSPGSQATFKRYGIDASATTGFTQALIGAIAKASAQGANWSGPQVQEISKAFFGPLRGGLLAGLLRGGQQLQAFGVNTAPQNAAGQAQREMNALLKQGDQQIKAIGVNTQALGAALGPTLLAPALGFVKALDSGLGVTTQLLGAWGQLPALVRATAGGAALLFGARAITQRIGLPAGIPFFGRSQQQTERLALTRGMGDETRFYQEQQSAAARGAAVASVRTQLSQQAVVAAVATGDQRQIADAQRVYERQLAQQRQLELERTALGKEAIAAEERLNLVTADLNRGLTAQQAAAAQGIAFRRATLVAGRMVPGAVQEVGPAVGGQSPGGVVLPVGAAAGSMQAAAVAASAQSSAWWVAKAEQSKVPAMMRGVTSSATAYGRAAAASVASIRGVGTGLSAIGRGTRGLVGALGGVIPTLLVASIAYGELASTQQGMDDAITQAQASLTVVDQSFSDARRSIATAEQKLNAVRTKESRGPLGGVPVLGDVMQGLSDLGDVITGWIPGSGIHGRSEDLRHQSNQYKQAIGLYGDVITAEMRDWQQLVKTPAGRARLYQTMGTTNALMKEWAGSNKERQRALKVALAANQQFYNNVQQSLTVLPIDPKDIFRQFGEQDLTTTSKQMQAVADKAQVYGATPQDVQQLAAGYQWVAQAYAGRTDSDSLQKIQTARQAFYSTVQAGVQNELDAAKNAATPQAADSAISRAQAMASTAKADLQRGEQQLQGRVNDAAAAWNRAVEVNGAMSKAAKDAFERYSNLRNQLSAAKASDRLLEQQLNQLVSSTAVDSALSTIQSATSLRTSAIRGSTPEADIHRQQSDLAGLNQQLAKAKAMGADWKTINDLHAQINNKMRDIASAQDQVAEDFLQSQTDLAVASIAGNSPEAEMARARATLAGLQAVLALHQKEHKDQTEINKDQAAILTQRNTLNQEQTDNAKSLMEAAGSIAKARITGTSPEADIARARADVAAAQRVLAFDTAHHAGQAQVGQDYAALLAAQGSLGDTIRQNAITADQDAQALIQARGALAQARTTDPVKQATLQLQTDIQVLGSIKPRDYKTYAEYLTAVTQAQTTVLKDRQSRTDVIVQGKEDDIQFYLDMGRISNSAAISQYQALLKMHNLTKATRRDILEKIHQLQAGSDGMSGYNFKPGDIKLPTPYDVSRAMRGAHGARLKQTQAMTAISAPTINVYVRSADDVAAVGDVIEKATGGHLRSRMRAAGVRGA